MGLGRPPPVRAGQCRSCNLRIHAHKHSKGNTQSRACRPCRPAPTLWPTGVLEAHVAGHATLLAETSGMKFNTCSEIRLIIKYQNIGIVSTTITSKNKSFEKRERKQVRSKIVWSNKTLKISKAKFWISNILYSLFTPSKKRHPTYFNPINRNHTSRRAVLEDQVMGPDAKAWCGLICISLNDWVLG